MNSTVTVLVTLVSSAALSMSSLGCSKKVDPSAFDAGTPSTPAPSVAAADPAAASASASAATDPAAPLPSLTPGAAAPAAAAGAAKPGTTKVNKNLPECVEARKFCNHPAIKFDKGIANLCTTNKQACFAKGGNL